ncbi:MAG: hypothetical protein ACP5QY_14735, partial [Candidatus Hydrogenedens sp.]
MGKKTQRFVLTIGLIAILLLSISPAYAWGPRARQALTTMAIQMIQSEFPYVFRPAGSAGIGYEKEAIQGSTDSWQTIAEFYSFENEKA